MHDKKTHDEEAPGAIEILAELCNEAVARHGSDRAAIEKHIADYFETLSEHDRSRLTSEIEKALKFSPPSPGGPH